ncbi:MAG: glycosyl transferase [Thermodesulfobacteriota bacterium]|nr:MAG: glycosyl transferase [Thermodesulfobacteriota bacterium]
MNNSTYSNKKIIHISAWTKTFTLFRLPLIRRLDELFEKQIICCTYEKEHAEKLSGEGFEVRNCNISSRFELGIFHQIIKLYRFLRKEKFDVSVSHQPMGALVGLSAAYLARVPVKIYSTGGLKYSPDNKNFASILYKYGEFVIMKLADAILTVNMEDYNYLQNIKSLAPKAYYVGPRGGCGIDTNQFSPDIRKAFREEARNELGIPDSTIVIGYIGRVVWEKGFTEIIDSAKILKRMGLTFVFLIFGEDGLDLDDVCRLIYKESLNDYFIFAGWKVRINYYMSAFDIFILPSYREGLPISLLQAMALGIPSIATNIRGSRQLIDNKRTGILITARDSEALANAICCYAKSKDLADTLSSNAADEIASMYSEEVMVNNTIQTYLKITDKNL